MLGSCCFTSSCVFLPTGSGLPAFHAEPKQAKNLKVTHCQNYCALCDLGLELIPAQYLVQLPFATHLCALFAPGLLSNYLANQKYTACVPKA